jgi:hypothetical protein
MYQEGTKRTSYVAHWDALECAEGNKNFPWNERFLFLPEITTDQLFQHYILEIPEPKMGKMSQIDPKLHKFFSSSVYNKRYEHKEKRT